MMLQQRAPMSQQQRLHQQQPGPQGQGTQMMMTRPGMQMQQHPRQRELFVQRAPPPHYGGPSPAGGLPNSSPIMHPQGPSPVPTYQPGPSPQQMQQPSPGGMLPMQPG